MQARITDNYKPAVYAQQWYPNSATASGGTAITVTTGQHVEDRDVTLTVPGSIKVSMLSPTGSPTPGDIALYDAGGRLVSNVDPGSTASFPALHPGTYKVRGEPLIALGYSEWYSWKRSFATANSITVTSGSTADRTLTLHYPTMTATTRPTVSVKGNLVATTHAKWKVKPHYVRYEWWRDGRRVEYEGFDFRITHKGDVGHRFKVCQIADRSRLRRWQDVLGLSRKVTTY